VGATAEAEAEDAAAVVAAVVGDDTDGAASKAY
jgi:hypothetical protein